MLISIISDIHNNEVNLKKVLDYCRKNEIKKIICCGDLASKETLDFLNDNFFGDIFYTFGNMDNDQLLNFEKDAEYKNTKIFKDFGEATFSSSPARGEALKEGWEQKIAFVHYPEVAKKLAQTKKYNFVFHGHTHKPWMEKIDNCLVLNPGNVAGEIYPPTFAVWNTEDGKFELIKVHDLE